ncbi:conserved hypothetical protein [Thermobaculum terrenum ATCC BAA-798]|uniref:DUF1343 domain-containing protein n=1 Tax=Thermobaculum terrenum (strain ATCC BAA-798 / CCMEE 7001 / YNP1) TaxID=525904 RepID=D1CCA4_THET1|nr:DUF1343 domain-containing protein [Thermobaculum terrenum]ACZ42419.1 conserved hypothetical protein [Thermobaculum terrenum ATCC BAA-798]
MRRRITTGLEKLLSQGSEAVEGRPIALLTNHTGVDRNMRHIVDLLASDDRFDLVALLAPEHGIRGEVQAGEKVSSYVDPRTGIPVYSLYGESYEPEDQLLRDIDAIVVDLQDVGVRYATYTSTLLRVMTKASLFDVDVIILDRPNPLSPKGIQGPLLQKEYTSFVGFHNVPVLHGMTLGEAACLLAHELGLREPIVIKMEGWERNLWYDDTDLVWVQPSPNLPTMDSLLLYPGTCLIEGTNISEGRGTTRPFEYIGAPWIDPYALLETLKIFEFPGVLFRATYFTPMFSKHSGRSCGGVQVHILDRYALRQVELGAYLLRAFYLQDEGKFEWIQNSEGKFFVDLLIGSDKLRKAVTSNTNSEFLDLVTVWREDALSFIDRFREVQLYQ